MKKIIAIFVLMLAFGFTASAQQKSAVSPKNELAAKNNEAAKQAAIKDIEMVSGVIKLTEDQKKALTPVFEYKHKTLLDHPDFSQERKSNLAQNLESKIKSSLTPEQVAKLEANPDMMKKLTN